jgi:hypothetical protein
MERERRASPATPSESSKAVELLVDVVVIVVVVVVGSDSSADCIVLHVRINGYGVRSRVVSCGGGCACTSVREAENEGRTLDAKRRGSNTVVARADEVVEVVVKVVVLLITGKVFDEVNERVSGRSGANCCSASWRIG